MQRPQLLASVICAVVFLTACQSAVVRRDNAVFMPRIGGDEQIVSQTSLAELRRLKLIATNLVSALVQVPEMQVSNTTIQVSKPVTSFGNVVVRALEDAGFGILRVSADQGLNYVSYGKRISETESGLVTDYSIAIGDIEVRREYNVRNQHVYPSSLLIVEGSNQIVDIKLDDTLFAEQGGTGDSFISGVGTSSIDGPATDIGTITVNDYDQTPQDKRTSHIDLLQQAKQNYYAEGTASNSSILENYSSVRRTVLIFENSNTRTMGKGNKKAIELLAQNYEIGDLYKISSCVDVDGSDASATIRGIRVKEAFVIRNIAAKYVHIAPCTRASYRHSSDKSPVAVTVVQLRREIEPQVRAQ